MITASALIEKFKYALTNDWGYIWGTAGVKWTEGRQNQLNQTTDADRANGRKYGAKWIGHMVADCSGLFTWAFKQLGGEMYHGSNTMFLKWCTDKGELSKGKRLDGKTLKPGTAVFVWNGKTYSHVGLYIGNGLVIEAKGTIAGVVQGKVTDSKWTRWGELKGISYEETSDSGFPDESVWHPTIRRGSKGDDVRLAQTMLYNLGYDLGKYGIDGDFGPATEAAVKEFQSDHKLTKDGVIGPLTWDALEKASEAIKQPSGDPVKYFTVTIRHLSKSQSDALKTNYPDATIEEE